jgi:hypothetical protein
MSQHDLILDNASGAAFRADANNALGALGSTMKGPNAPPAPIAGMMWLDDDTPSASVWTLKLYDGADWLTIGFFDISANIFSLAIGGPLLAAAGSAGSPAYSFAGDPDTGIYNSGPNVIAVAVGGGRVFTISDGNATVDMNSAGDVFFLMRNNGASGSVARGAVTGFLNESSVVVAATNVVMQADGGSRWYLETTPAGSRVSDRRVVRLDVPASGPVVVNSGGLDVNNDLRFNSGYGSAALAFGCRAWVNFNGTGTVAIRASGNVSSITDNGTGDYTVNFTTAMPDVNYCVIGVGSSSSPDMLPLGIKGDVAPTTSSVRVHVKSVNVANNYFDPLYANIAIFR